MTDRNLSHYLIDRNRPLMECLKRINKFGNQILFCTNDSGIITGSITDGDIRRALIDRKDPSIPANEIANKKFIKAKPGISRVQARMIMEERSIRHLPVIEKGRLVNVITYEDLIDKFINVPVLIFAGGKGRRLRPLTSSTPKPLLNIGKKTVIENILEKIISEGFADFRIALNYKPDLIIRKLTSRFPDFIDKNTFIIENKPMGTAGSLMKVKLDGSDSIITYNADILSDINVRMLLNSHIKAGNDITSVLIPFNYTIPFGIAGIEDEHIKYINEKPKRTEMILAGINIFSAISLKKLACRGKCDMNQLIEKAISSDMQVGHYIHNGFWTDIGEMETYNIIDSIFRGAE